MVSLVAVSTGGPAATTSAGITSMPTHAAGDRVLIFLIGKDLTASQPITPTNYTHLGTHTGGTGAAATDAGAVFCHVYARDMTASGTGGPSINSGATQPNSWVWIAGSFRPGGGKTWRDSLITNAPYVRSASDTNTASPLTGTTTDWGAGNYPEAGDLIFSVAGFPTDAGSALGATSTITNAGLSGGTKSLATSQYIENALGLDMGAAWISWSGFTGTASAGLALSYVITGASNHSGVVVGAGLREMDAPYVPKVRSVISNPAHSHSHTW